MSANVPSRRTLILRPRHSTVPPRNAATQIPVCRKSFTGTSQKGETSDPSGEKRRWRFWARTIRTIKKHTPASSAQKELPETTVATSHSAAHRLVLDKMLKK